MLQDSTQTSLWRLLVAAMSEKKKLNNLLKVSYQNDCVTISLLSSQVLSFLFVYSSLKDVTVENLN